MTMPTNGGDAAASAPGPGPQLSVLGQYIKDLSFENPNAPRSLNPSSQPQINVAVAVGAGPFQDGNVEIELKLEGKAEVPGTVLFSFELIYAGMFRITNVPEEHLHPLMLIECPRILFPFAREIIATAVRNGGFPPLLLDPIDFVSLYQEKLAEQQQSEPPAATA